MSGKEDGMLDSLFVKADLDIADEDKATKVFFFFFFLTKNGRETKYI